MIQTPDICGHFFFTSVSEGQKQMKLKKIEVAEMRFYRQLMRLSRPDKMTKKEVMRKFGFDQTCIMKAIRK